MSNLMLLAIGAAHPAAFASGSGAPAMSGATIDVRAFGARGDGAHDDTKAIQAAIDAAQSHPGGATVLLPPGRYLVRKGGELRGKDRFPSSVPESYALRISSGNVSLRGVRATIVLGDGEPGAVSMLTIGGDARTFSHVVVSHLIFDGGHQAAPRGFVISGGIFVIGARPSAGRGLSDIHLDHDTVKNVTMTADQGSIELHGQVTNSSIDDCTVIGGTGNGIFLDGAAGIRMRGNLITRPGENGIDVQPNSDNDTNPPSVKTLESINLRIVGNTIINPRSRYHAMALVTSGSIVTGNTVVMGGGGSHFGNGLYVLSYHSASGKGYGSSGNVISANCVKGGYFGLDIDGNVNPALFVSHNRITGNEVSGDPIKAVYVGSNARANRIAGNIIRTSNPRWVAFAPTAVRNQVDHNVYLATAGRSRLGSAPAHTTMPACAHVH